MEHILGFISHVINMNSFIYSMMSLSLQNTHQLRKKRGKMEEKVGTLGTFYGSCCPTNRQNYRLNCQRFVDKRGKIAEGDLQCDTLKKKKRIPTSKAIEGFVFSIVS